MSTKTTFLEKEKTQQRNRKENKIMSRVSDLENKVAALERNVGMLAELADVNDCLKIAEYSSIVHYKEGVEELYNSRKQLDDIISEAKLENSLKLIELINIGLKKIGVEAKIVVNPFETSATIYHTYVNNKGVDTEKPKVTIPLHDIIRK